MNVETKEIFNNTFVEYLPICDKCLYKEFEIEYLEDENVDGKIKYQDVWIRCKHLYRCKYVQSTQEKEE